MMIEAAAILLVVVAAFAFGYHTGYDKGQDDAAFRQLRRGAAARPRADHARSDDIRDASLFDGRQT